MMAVMVRNAWLSAKPVISTSSTPHRAGRVPGRVRRKVECVKGVLRRVALWGAASRGYYATRPPGCRLGHAGYLRASHTPEGRHHHAHQGGVS